MIAPAAAGCKRQLGGVIWLDPLLHTLGSAPVQSAQGIGSNGIAHEISRAIRVHRVDVQLERLGSWLDVVSLTHQMGDLTVE
jgi:hypothetical protein